MSSSPTELATTETAESAGLSVTPKATVAFHTLGCRANQLETSTLAGNFEDLGWEVGSFDEPADVYVINTCTVTERADQESRRMIRRARLSNPNARIAVTGCYAQVAPEELAAQDGVSLVVGNNYKDELPALVVSTMQESSVSESAIHEPLVKVSEIDKSRIMVGASSAAIDRTRGSLKIQDGCDYKCTYCIIWQARGASRSLSVEDVKLQLGRMIFEGFKEIMLTGINIGQYEHDGYNLADLLRELCTLPGSFRLRLTSLDPLEVTDTLIDVVANSHGKICPYFHLSAQSANDDVLKRMARRHHVAGMQATCRAIVERIPHACIGSDLIVGFPGETLPHFESTVAALDETPMHYLHVFSYSRRKNTPAAEFEDGIPEREKKRRAHVLREWSDKRSLAFRQQFIGQELDVLLEDSLDDEGQPKALSENYIKVSLSNAHLLPRLEWSIDMSAEDLHSPSIADGAAQSTPISTSDISTENADSSPPDKIAVRPNDRVRANVVAVSADSVTAVVMGAFSPVL